MDSVRISSGELAYVDRGSGRPILLVHGFPLDHTMWDAQIAALSQRARVVAPDLRGFGKSPLGAVDASRGITMEQYADDLSELLAALEIEEPTVLVGFSMGGYVAWQFVRKYADRLHALVACDTRAAADSEEARGGRLKMAEKVAEWGSARVAEMMGPKLVSSKSYETKPQVVAAVRRMVEDTDPSAIAAAQRGMAQRADITNFLPQIHVPTLVIVGEEDAISPPTEMQEIAAAIANSQFAVIPNSGHMSPMENPEGVNECLLHFISGLTK
jgi:3-oxoadipate enol-lactonase